MSIGAERLDPAGAGSRRNLGDPAAAETAAAARREATTSRDAYDALLSVKAGQSWWVPLSFLLLAAAVAAGLFDGAACQAGWPRSPLRRAAGSASTLASPGGAEMLANLRVAWCTLGGLLEQG